MLQSANTSYYIADYWNNRVYKLNNTWEYVGQNSFSNPSGIIAVSNNLYIASESQVYKTDSNLNVLNQYNNSINSPAYRGIFYNPTDCLIYIAAYNDTVKAVHLFDLNLHLNGSISTSEYNPWSIVGFDNQIYIGTLQGVVIVIFNKTITTSFKGCLGISLISSILFDQLGYMAITCLNENRLYLYNSNGFYVGKSLATGVFPLYTEFDSIGRFVLLSQNQISIFY